MTQNKAYPIKITVVFSITQTYGTPVSSLDEYLIERCTKYHYLPKPVLKKGKKKDKTITNIKKPKPKQNDKWIMKPGNCYAHRKLDVKECTK